MLHIAVMFPHLLQVCSYSPSSVRILLASFPGHRRKWSGKFKLLQYFHCKKVGRLIVNQISGPYHPTNVLTRNLVCIMRFILFKSLVKPYLVKYMYFKWFLEVIEGQRANGLVKGTFCFRPDRRILHMQLHRGWNSAVIAIPLQLQI